MRAQNVSINYRSDIDGLRGMAVAAVVLYHAFPKAVKGGFIGVDIFFVLSGYLISKILLSNFDANNFSLYDFYARRVKRIFPALILILLSCLTFGWFVLDSMEYTQLGKHALASAFFYTNFVLISEAGYFDNTSNLKPLLHLWSLCIEEQFYIFWPLILFLAKKKGFNLISICTVIILGSFYISTKTVAKNNIEAFYLPLPRIWELLSGACLAYFSLNRINIVEKLKKLINHWLNIAVYKDYPLDGDMTLKNSAAMAGFLLNLSCIILLKKTTNFPGFIVILPVLGTLLILAAGEDAWINKIILSNKICVWLGLISYPLYMWHWPLLSFATILENHTLGRKVIWIILLLSIFLAWLTYRFIEKPIRTTKNKTFIVFVLSTTLLLIGIFGYQICKHKGYAFRAGSMAFPWAIHLNEDFLALKISDPFWRIANSVKPDFAILGDSHALAFGYGAVLHNLDMLLIAGGGILPFVNYVAYSPNYIKKNEQLTLHNQQIEYINNTMQLYTSVKYVILVSRGSIYFSSKGFGIEEQHESANGWVIEPVQGGQLAITSQEAFVEGYVETINYFHSLGKKVIFAIDIPELGVDPRTCFKRPINISKQDAADCLVHRDVVQARQKEYRELVAKIQQRVPSLLVYDPISAFCDDIKCYGKKNNIIYYYDDDHLNTEGAKLLINHFYKWLIKKAIYDPVVSIKTPFILSESMYCSNIICSDFF